MSQKRKYYRTRYALWPYETKVWIWSSGSWTDVTGNIEQDSAHCSILELRLMGIPDVPDVS